MLESLFNKITGQPRRFPVNFRKAMFTLYEKFLNFESRNENIVLREKLEN